MPSRCIIRLQPPRSYSEPSRSRLHSPIDKLPLYNRTDPIYRGCYTPLYINIAAGEVRCPQFSRILSNRGPLLRTGTSSIYRPSYYPLSSSTARTIARTDDLSFCWWTGWLVLPMLWTGDSLRENRSFQWDVGHFSFAVGHSDCHDLQQRELMARHPERIKPILYIVASRLTTFRS